MRKIKEFPGFHRAGVSALGLVAVAIALVRCSPLAPSVSKSSLNGLGNRGGVAASHTEAPVQTEDAPLATPPAELDKEIHVFSYGTLLLNSESFKALISRTQKSAKKLLLSKTDSPALFAALARNKEVEIPGDSVAVEQASVYLELAVTRSESENFQLNGFDLMLNPKENGKWLLGVAPGASEETVARALAHLETILIIVKGNENVVTAGPSSSPSPSAAPSPVLNASPVPQLLTTETVMAAPSASPSASPNP